MKTWMGLLIGLSLILLPAPLAAADKAGDVVSVRGTATIERGTQSLAAKRRAQLLVQDQVQTEAEARVKMLFRDDSILTLGPSSRLVVEKYLFSPENRRAESIFQLLDGKLRAVVGSQGFQVATPTAFAAARGTIFAIWYDAVTQATGLAVLEGEVLTRSSDPAILGEQLLQAGQFTEIPSGAPPQPPTALQMLNLARIGSLTGVEAGDVDSLLGDQSGVDLAALELPLDAPQSVGPEDVQPFEPLPQPPIEQTPTDDILTTPVTLDLVFPDQVLE